MTKDSDSDIYEPAATADASIIWLHGLGASGNDFLGVVNQLGLPDANAVRFIFPNAPFISITVNQGMKMRGWYDIYDLNLLRKEDAAGIKNSQRILTQLIDHELNKGIASNRIILAGFSQGGAMTLYTGLRYPKPLGGIVSLSGYLPLAADFTAAAFPENLATPIFIAHGLFDPVVPFNAGKSACQQLQDQDYKIDWKTYPMAHTVTLDEIYDIGTFIRRCLGYA